MWTHNADREQIFLNGSLRYQWLEASTGSLKLGKTSRRTCLAQGPNHEWRLFSVDDISYDEEEDRWIYQWSQGTLAALVPVLILLFCVFLAATRYPTSTCRCSPAVESRLLHAIKKQGNFLLLACRGSAIQRSQGSSTTRSRAGTRCLA